jgi:hypothetical protein
MATRGAVPDCRVSWMLWVGLLRPKPPLPPPPLPSNATLPQVIKQQLADGVSTRRVGFVSSGAPARQHSEVG